MGKAAYFFLGANSREGFYSLYDDFVNVRKDDFLWLIKGGPGCGKSSFMRRIGKAAEARGLEVEYIRCSGDPSSLDGIYIPQKKLGYADATAPHIMDANLPAAGDAYLDLGAFYRISELRDHQTQLADMNRQYKAMYGRIYSLLKAAGELGTDKIGGLVTEADLHTVRKRALSAAERELGRSTLLQGSEKHRFISAISCMGLMRLYDTVGALCSRVYALDDEFGLADCYLRTLSAEVAARGLDTIICHDPLQPEKYEALLIPKLKLGFVANRPLFGESPEYARNVRLDAVIPKERVQKERRKIRAGAKIKAALLDEAVAALKEAKQLHDEIEAIYNPHVDFDGLYQLCDRHIESILGK